MATRSLQRLARVTQTGASWNRAWERPFCAQACFPITVSLETKGPFSLGLDAAISGWQCQVVGASGGVNLLSPPTLRSSGARCWGGGCSMLCCHGNHPNPHLPKHKERQLSPPPPPRKNLGLVGNLPLGILFLLHQPWLHKHHPLFSPLRRRVVQPEALAKALRVS